MVTILFFTASNQLVPILCSSMPYFDLFNARNKDNFRFLGVSFGLALNQCNEHPTPSRVCTAVSPIPSNQRPVGLRARLSTSRLKPIAALLPTSVGLEVEFRQARMGVIMFRSSPAGFMSTPGARQGCQSTCAMFAKLNCCHLGQVSRNLGAEPRSPGLTCADW